MAAGTGNHPLLLIRRMVLQQFGQCGRPSLMHRRTDDGFDGFEVETTGLAPILKNRVQQPVYFAGNFLLDRLSRFFSSVCGVASSTGRRRQILRLMSISSPVKV